MQGTERINRTESLLRYMQGSLADKSLNRVSPFGLLDERLDHCSIKAYYHYALREKY